MVCTIFDIDKQIADKIADSYMQQIWNKLAMKDHIIKGGHRKDAWKVMVKE